MVFAFFKLNKIIFLKILNFIWNVKCFIPSALGLRFCTLKKEFAEANGLPAPPPPRPAPAVQQPEEEEEVEEEAAPAEVAAADDGAEKVELVFPADEEGVYYLIIHSKRPERSNSKGCEMVD